MNRTAQPRLRVPIVMAVGGTTIALATILGRGFASAAVVEAVTLVAAMAYYSIGGRDTDAGALVGARADERQVAVGLRSSALAGRVTTLVALGGFVIQTARGGTTGAFALICVVGAISFVAGLALYRD